MTIATDSSEFSQLRTDVGQMARGFAALETHIKSLVGPPSLEQRLTEYIDKRDEHKERNAQDAILNLQRLLEQDSQIRQLQIENKLLEQRAEIARAHALAEQTERMRVENHSVNLAEQKSLTRRVTKMERIGYIIAGFGLGIQAYIAWVVQHPQVHQVITGSGGAIK